MRLILPPPPLLRAALSLLLSASLAAQTSQTAPAAVPGGGSLPPEQGEVLLARDRNGLPHVYADSDAGAFFGAGFAAAEDRLFQMHWRRLMYEGRVAEFFGPGTVAGEDTHVAHDRRARLLGWARHADAVVARLDAETHALLQAYADGVNAAIARPTTSRHPLFAQTGVPVEDWTVRDCIGVWLSFARHFAPIDFAESQRRHAVEDLVASGLTLEEAVELVLGPQVCNDDAAVVQERHVPEPLREAMTDYARRLGLRGGARCGNPAAGRAFSQAWVVAGARSTTGTSLLVGDPRVPVLVPNTFYEWSMEGETIRACGVGIAGSPNMLVGANADVSWTVTALSLDQADLFLLEARADGHYLLDGAWTPYLVDELETIRVLGQPDQTLHYRTTLFGPVVTELARGVKAGEEYALSAVPFALPEADTSAGFVSMLRAGSVPAFFEALAGATYPSAAFLFAGRSASGARGSIGYAACGAMPIRSPGQFLGGVLAQDGTDSAAAWIDFLPHELRPHVLDPVEGVLYSANHRSVGSWYPIPFPGGRTSRGHTFRSRRLAQLVETAPPVLTPQEAFAFHHDTVQPARAAIAELGVFLRDEQTSHALSADARLAVDELEGWLAAGARMDNSHYATALAAAIPLDFELSGAPDLVEQFGNGENGLDFFLHTIVRDIRREPPRWLTATEATLLDVTLASAARRMRNVGPPSTWQAWYEQDSLEIELPLWTSLERFPSLDPAGSQPLRLPTGDHDTLLSPDGQSYTLLDGGLGLDAGRTAHPPGASEHPGRHFVDQLPLLENESFKASPTSFAAALQVGFESVRWIR